MFTLLGHDENLNQIMSKNNFAATVQGVYHSDSPTGTIMKYLSYEAYLDEVTTLLTELYDLDDAAAIKLVVDAQDAEYFVHHDDHEEMRTLERANQDAVALHKAHLDKVKTQKSQQKRVWQSKKP